MEISPKETHSNLFQELHSIMNAGFDVQLNISVMPDGTMAVISQPRFHDAKAQDLSKAIRAITMFGTPEELDKDFVKNLVRPIDHVAKKLTGNADLVIADADKTVKGDAKKPAAKPKAEPKEEAKPEPEVPKKPQATDTIIAQWVDILTPTDVRWATPSILDRFRTEADGYEIKPDDKKRLDMLETAAVNHNKTQVGKTFPRGVLTEEKIAAMERHLSNGNPIDKVKAALKEYEYGEEFFERLEQLVEKYKENKPQEELF